MSSSRKNAKWLMEVAQGGRVVVLGDKSMWKVSPDGRQNTWFWKLASSIAVFNSDNPLYPIRLINEDKNDAIDGKFIGFY